MWPIALPIWKMVCCKVIRSLPIRTRPLIRLVRTEILLIFLLILQHVGANQRFNQARIFGLIESQLSQVGSAMDSDSTSEMTFCVESILQNS